MQLNVIQLQYFFLFSPNVQIQPKLLVSINRIDIYISSYMFVLNGSILMELRLNTFPFHVSIENNFPFQFLMHIKMIKMGVELMGGV